MSASNPTPAEQVARHAANPPESWTVERVNARCWAVNDTDGHTVTSKNTRREAVAALTSGWDFEHWHKRARWYAGEAVTGWKSWETCKAEQERNAARWAKHKAAEAKLAATTPAPSAPTEGGTVTETTEADPLAALHLDGDRYYSESEFVAVCSCGHKFVSPYDGDTAAALQLEHAEEALKDAPPAINCARRAALSLPSGAHEETIPDAIADLLHLAALVGLDSADVIDTAGLHFDAETEEG